MRYSSGLPWKRETDKQAVLKIKEFHKQNPSTMFTNLPCVEDLTGIYKYITKIEYFDSLDYNYMYSLLTSAAAKCNRKIDAPYEWEIQHKKDTEPQPPKT